MISKEFSIRQLQNHKQNLPSQHLLHQLTKKKLEQKQRNALSI